LLTVPLMKVNIGRAALRAAAASATCGQAGKTSRAIRAVVRTVTAPISAESSRATWTASAIPRQGKASSAGSWIMWLMLPSSGTTPMSAWGLIWLCGGVAASIRSVPSAARK